MSIPAWLVLIAVLTTALMILLATADSDPIDHIDDLTTTTLIDFYEDHHLS